MFSAVRRRLTYANVAMTLALVFAMSGGAYAAGKYLITSTKQISPKVLKSLVGKTGPAGKNGTNGTNGANGAPGEKGAQGLQGPQGPEGKEGKAGEPGKDGKAGTNGTTGFTTTLPPEKTETGTWSFNATAGGLQEVLISFPIPLSKTLTETQVHYIGAHNGMEILYPEPAHGLVFTGPTRVEQASTECLGSYKAPTAEPGNLCVYVNPGEAGIAPFNFLFVDPASEAFSEEAGPTGTVMQFEASSENGDAGTWAVTAPES